MIYGIDLGTTNSLIGSNGKVIATMVPSVVNMETGNAGASEYMNFNAFRNFKTSMMAEAPGLRAMQASSCVLKELKRVAGVTGPMDAVISVPAYFSDSQRIATRAAARQADINTVAIINEPTAAALIISSGKDGTFIVFDLGGGTFDISVVECKNGIYRVLATDGCILGGKDLDSALLTALATESGLNWRVTDEEGLCVASAAKVVMQKHLDKSPVPIKFSGLDKEVYLTYDTYIKCMKSVFEKAILLTQNVMSEANVDPSTTEFYFVGGSTRCPFLREWVTERLGVKVAPVTYNPDMVVAEGAVKYAGLMESGDAHKFLDDVTKQVGIKLHGELLDIIVPKNTHLPYKNDYIFVASTNEEVQDVSIGIYTGDSVIASECTNIGTVNLHFEHKMPAGLSIFGVKVEVDLNQNIDISVDEIMKTPVKLHIAGDNR